MIPGLAQKGHVNELIKSFGKKIGISIVNLSSETFALPNHGAFYNLKT